jgi:GT2 family glycosyltransferase
VLQDYDLWLKLWKQGKKFYNVNEIKVLHRIHKESAFNSKGNHLLVPKLINKYK